MKRTLAFLAPLAFCGFLHATPLTVGAEAPKITAIDQNGAPYDFAKAYDKGLTLVYFYPKANSGGCTKQACSLRDAFPDLTAKGITVIGVSEDTVDEQKKFEVTNKLPYTLIADKDGKVATAFGVDMIPDKPFTKRESFIVKDGKIAWVDLQAGTEKHADEVRAAVANLK